MHGLLMIRFHDALMFELETSIEIELNILFMIDRTYNLEIFMIIKFILILYVRLCLNFEKAVNTTTPCFTK